MDCGMAELLQLMPPPGAPDAPVEWDAVREQWGTGFPADYREFVDRYGTGTISDQLVILQPNSPGLRSGQPCMNSVDQEWLDDTESPFPAWPAPGGLIQWAEDSNENMYFWAARGDDPDQWPVIVWEGASFDADGFLEFPPGMIKLLLVAFGNHPPRPFDSGFWMSITRMRFVSVREEERLRGAGVNPWAGLEP